MESESSPSALILGPHLNLATPAGGTSLRPPGPASRQRKRGPRAPKMDIGINHIRDPAGGPSGQTTGGGGGALAHPLRGESYRQPSL